MVKIHVPDMSCGHCKASITAALEPIGATSPSFDMEARTVSTTGVDAESVIEALDEIGFPATLVSS